jgi:hypothetical protein
MFDIFQKVFHQKTLLRTLLWGYALVIEILEYIKNFINETAYIRHHYSETMTRNSLSKFTFFF